jgi:hypothetical protein
MSNQPGLSFERDEWELIVTLPRRVLIAAVVSAPAEGRLAAEGIAGIEAIASGLASTSTLVREVVASIYSEDYPAVRAEPLHSDQTSADIEVIPTLAACRYAAEILANRAAEPDATAYREWLLHIAAVVSGVAQGVAGVGRVALSESRFLYALGGVLRP